MESEKKPDQKLAMGVLKQMSSEERIIFGLYFYENLSVSEIGAVLGKQETLIDTVLENVFNQILNYVPAATPLDTAITSILGV